MEGISRIDSRNTHGWFVRIYYNALQEHRKFFSDGKHGEKKEALDVAKRYREEYKRKNPPPKKYPFRVERIRSNTSGVNGISETFQRSSGGGKKIPCFNVSWAPRSGEHRCKRFYHNHYVSREEALKAAVEFRKEKEAEILKLEKAGKR